MESDRNVGTREAFSRFQESLTFCVSSFLNWSDTPGYTDAFLRIRAIIAGFVEEDVTMYLSEIGKIVDRFSAEYFDSLNEQLSQAMDELGLKNIHSVVGCLKIARWAAVDLAEILNFRSYVKDYSPSNSYAKHEAGREVASEEMMQKVRDAKRKFDEPGNVEFNGRVQNQSDPTTPRVISRLMEELETLREFSEKNAAALYEARELIEQSAQRAEQAEQNYLAVRSQQEVLNAEDSKTALINYFSTYQSGHAENSRKYFWSGISVLFAVAVFASTYMFMHIPTGPDWSGFAWKLTVVGGTSAIGTYLLRQASYHRQLAVWSQTVQVQLQTFTPYIQLIGDEAAKDQLRMEFAKRVFGNEPGIQKESNSDDAGAVSMTEISTLIASLAKLQAPRTPKATDRESA